MNLFTEKLWPEFCKNNDVGEKYFDINLNTLDRYLFEYLGQWEKNKTSVILMGQAGRGKTYFSLCMAALIVYRQKGHQVIYRRSKQIDDRLLADIREYGSCSDHLNTLSKVPYLIIDDFGIERATETSQRNYYEIINARCENNLCTILSTNLNDKSIFEIWGERMFSRFKEYQRVEISGRDRRGT